MSLQMIGGQTRFMALAALAISACSSGEPETAFARSSTPRSAAALGEQSSVPSAESTALRLVMASTGNAARYRVRERLVGHDFPNDAVGETQNLIGAISF